MTAPASPSTFAATPAASMYGRIVEWVAAHDDEICELSRFYRTEIGIKAHDLSKIGLM